MSAGQKRVEYRTRERSSDAFYSAPAGKRVVKGTNYMITCKQRIVVPDWQEHLVNIIINNVPADKWTIAGQADAVPRDCCSCLADSIEE